MIKELKAELESLKAKAAVEALNEEAMLVEESLVNEVRIKFYLLE